MTTFDDMLAQTQNVQNAVFGVTLTYTEAGAAGQAVTGVAHNFRLDRQNNVKKDFVFKSSDLTIDDENWRGASITDADSKVYRVQERETYSEYTLFTGVRALERS
jgi:hypothetical protein